ncbi:hypothetical protein HJFPF1_04645 [Paramyrothecium foliicola]|nr:hypothetical protein HJFPF1_04645 [Paramyrothecium foliicola]
MSDNIDPTAIERACMADLGRGRQEELPLSYDTKRPSYLPNKSNGTSHYKPAFKSELKDAWNVTIADEESEQIEGLYVGNARPWAQMTEEYMDRHKEESAPPRVVTNAKPNNAELEAQLRAAKELHASFGLAKGPTSKPSKGKKKPGKPMVVEPLKLEKVPSRPILISRFASRGPQKNLTALAASWKQPVANGSAPKSVLKPRVAAAAVTVKTVQAPAVQPPKQTNTAQPAKEITAPQPAKQPNPNSQVQAPPAFTAAAEARPVAKLSPSAPTTRSSQPVVKLPPSSLTVQSNQPAPPSPAVQVVQAALTAENLAQATSAAVEQPIALQEITLAPAEGAAATDHSVAASLIIVEDESSASEVDWTQEGEDMFVFVEKSAERVLTLAVSILKDFSLKGVTPTEETLQGIELAIIERWSKEGFLEGPMVYFKDEVMVILKNLIRIKAKGVVQKLADDQKRHAALSPNTKLLAEGLLQTEETVDPARKQYQPGEIKALRGQAATVPEAAVERIDSVIETKTGTPIHHPVPIKPRPTAGPKSWPTVFKDPAVEGVTSLTDKTNGVEAQLPKKSQTEAHATPQSQVQPQVQPTEAKVFRGLKTSRWATPSTNDAAASKVPAEAAAHPPQKRDVNPPGDKEDATKQPRGLSSSRWAY